MRKFIATILILLIPAFSFAEDKFIRTVKEKGDTIALETAVASYSKEIKGKTVVVDVYGAVHVADKSYYIKLNNDFKSYDKVLYELVTSEAGQRPEKGKQDAYSIIKDFIELDNQLGVVDYQPKNFLHADLTKNQLVKKMRNNGDDMKTLALEFVLHVIRQQNKTNFAIEDAAKKGNSKGRLPSGVQDVSKIQNMDLMQLLADPNRAVKIKRMMANSMGNSDLSDSFGPTIGGYLIDERNKKCISVLEGELSKNNGDKYAVFYGAAHMPDLEKRLLDLGFKKINTKWKRAWDNLRPSKTNEDPFLELLYQLEK